MNSPGPQLAENGSAWLGGGALVFGLALASAVQTSCSPMIWASQSEPLVGVGALLAKTVSHFLESGRKSWLATRGTDTGNILLSLLPDVDPSFQRRLMESNNLALS
eukprot:gene546-441_t